MSLIVEGRVSALVFFAGIIILIAYSINESRRGKKYAVKRIQALEALDEVIGRAAELGKPVYINCGRTGITGQYVQQTTAGFGVLHKVATDCARLDIPLIHLVGTAEQLPSVTDIMTQAYQSQNKVLDEVYSIRYAGQSSTGFFGTKVGIFTREKPATNIMVGGYFWEAIMLLDVAAQHDAVTVGGTARIMHIPYFVACADWAFIGEEIFASGAYLSGDDRQLGSLHGQDLSKLLVIISLLVVFVAALVGSDISSIFQS